MLTVYCSGKMVGEIPEVAKVGEVVREHNLLTEGGFLYWKISSIEYEKKVAQAYLRQPSEGKGFHWELR